MTDPGDIGNLPTVMVIRKLARRARPLVRFSTWRGNWQPGQTLRVMAWIEQGEDTWAAVLDEDTKRVGWSVLKYAGVAYMRVIGAG